MRAAGVELEQQLAGHIGEVAVCKSNNDETLQMRKVPRCQVPGCNKDLSEEASYNRRHKICATHVSSDSIPVIAAQLRPPAHILRRRKAALAKQLMQQHKQQEKSGTLSTGGLEDINLTHHHWPSQLQPGAASASQANDAGLAGSLSAVKQIGAADTACPATPDTASPDDTTRQQQQLSEHAGICQADGVTCDNPTAQSQGPQHSSSNGDSSKGDTAPADQGSEGNDDLADAEGGGEAEATAASAETMGTAANEEATAAASAATMGTAAEEEATAMDQSIGAAGQGAAEENKCTAEGASCLNPDAAADQLAAAETDAAGGTAQEEAQEDQEEAAEEPSGDGQDPVSVGQDPAIVNVRWCQQCGRLEKVSAFDGNRRSCRAQLQRHNSRRRAGLKSARKLTVNTTAKSQPSTRPQKGGGKTAPKQPQSGSTSASRDMHVPVRVSKRRQQQLLDQLEKEQRHAEEGALRDLQLLSEAAAAAEQHQPPAKKRHKDAAASVEQQTWPEQQLLELLLNQQQQQQQQQQLLHMGSITSTTCGALAWPTGVHVDTYTDAYCTTPAVQPSSMATSHPQQLLLNSIMNMTGVNAAAGSEYAAAPGGGGGGVPRRPDSSVSAGSSGLTNNTRALTSTPLLRGDGAHQELTPEQRLLQTLMQQQHHLSQQKQHVEEQLRQCAATAAAGVADVHSFLEARSALLARLKTLQEMEEQQQPLLQAAVSVAAAAASVQHLRSNQQQLLPGVALQGAAGWPTAAQAASAAAPAGFQEAAARGGERTPGSEQTWATLFELLIQEQLVKASLEEGDKQQPKQQLQHQLDLLQQQLMLKEQQLQQQMAQEAAVGVPAASDCSPDSVTCTHLTGPTMFASGAASHVLLPPSPTPASAGMSSLHVSSYLPPAAQQGADERSAHTTNSRGLSARLQQHASSAAAAAAAAAGLDMSTSGLIAAVGTQQQQRQQQQQQQSTDDLGALFASGGLDLGALMMRELESAGRQAHASTHTLQSSLGTMTAIQQAASRGASSQDFAALFGCAASGAAAGIRAPGAAAVAGVGYSFVPPNSGVPWGQQQQQQWRDTPHQPLAQQQQMAGASRDEQQAAKVQALVSFLRQQQRRQQQQHLQHQVGM